MSLAIKPDGSAIVCRAARPDDQSYVAASWTRSMASTEQLGLAASAQLVDRVLNDPGTRVAVACEPDGEQWNRSTAIYNWERGEMRSSAWSDAEHLTVAERSSMFSRILGFVCWADTPRVRCVHYVSVRAKRRREGIAATLARYAKLDDDRPLVYTLEGPSARGLLERFPNATKIALEEVLQ